MKKGIFLALSVCVALILWAGIHQSGVLEQFSDISDEIYLNLTHWTPEDFPLQVRVDVSSISQERRERIFAVIEHWNLVIGERVFEPSEVDLAQFTIRGVLSRPPRGEIFIQETELGLSREEGTVLGLTELRRGGFTLDFTQSNNATVLLDNDILFEDLFVVTVHELGHVLGLGHDRDANSVMYPYVLESGGVIMENDIEYIRRQLRPMFVPDFLMTPPF